jgi:hypothetical protein
MYSAKVRENPIKMKKNMRVLHFVLVAVMVIILAAVPKVWAEDNDDEIPFDEAIIYFELNDTDGDLGIHALIDGEPWKRLEIEDPRERKMLNIYVQGRLRRQGLTELFFESAEPTFGELLPERFFRRFKEGWYEIEGTTLDGEELESEVFLSHVMPAPADEIYVNGIPAAEDCDAVELPSVSADEPVTIAWEAVTTSHPEIGNTDPDIDIVGIQFVVEYEDEDENTFVYSVDLPGDATSFKVPVDFLVLSDEFKFEILAREASGNQTAVESCFEIEELDGE